MGIRVDQRVRVKKNAQAIRRDFRGQDGLTTGIFGERDPFAYMVKLDTGAEILVRGDEIEDAEG